MSRLVEKERNKFDGKKLVFHEEINDYNQIKGLKKIEYYICKPSKDRQERAETESGYLFIFLLNNKLLYFTIDFTINCVMHRKILYMILNKLKEYLNKYESYPFFKKQYDYVRKIFKSMQFVEETNCFLEADDEFHLKNGEYIVISTIYEFDELMSNYNRDISNYVRFIEFTNPSSTFIDNLAYDSSLKKQFQNNPDKLDKYLQKKYCWIDKANKFLETFPIFVKSLSLFDSYNITQLFRKEEKNYLYIVFLEKKDIYIRIIFSLQNSNKYPLKVVDYNILSDRKSRLSNANNILKFLAELKNNKIISPTEAKKMAFSFIK